MAHMGSRRLFSRMLKEYKRTEKLSNAELARRLRVSKNSVSDWLREVSLPSLPSLKQVIDSTGGEESYFAWLLQRYEVTEGRFELHDWTQRFPVTVRRLRTQRGLTQEGLAELLDCSVDCVSNWELGNQEPGSRLLQKMAGVFGETMEYILGAPESALSGTTMGERLDRSY